MRRAVPIFRSLSNTQLRRLEDVVQEVTFKEGARVFSQGDQFDYNFYACFLLQHVQGLVQVLPMQ